MHRGGLPVRGTLVTPGGLVGIATMTFVLLAAVLAPWVSPFGPNEGELTGRLQPPLSETPDGRLHLLGTDQIGRDVLSRIIYGSRVSLLVGFTAVPISMVLGSAVGLVSGYRLGVVDEIFMRLADIQLAIPFIVLALAVLAVLGPSLLNLIIALGVTSWVHYARLVRGEVLSVRQREFVLAAEAMGASHWRTVRHHILPNVSATIVIWSTILLPRLIMAEAGLSFLGLGIQPPTPSWGGMISQGREYVWTAWWLSTFSGMAISVTVLGANLMGDWLRDALDPRLRNRASANS